MRELKRQFNASLYERLALSRNRKGIRELAREGQIVSRPAGILKEPLVLEFLGLHESAQYSGHYFADLVFYNRLLRCYVLIDLKLGKLTHQDLGQMQM